MHYAVRLSDLSVIGPAGPLPPELSGLDQSSLDDLSVALAPCPAQWEGIGFWPACSETVSFDPMTQRMSGQVTETPDPMGKVVNVRPLVVDMTPAEIAAAAEAAKPPVPAAVTNFQARAALLTAGLFEKVDGALMALPARSTARQAWEYANELTRNGTLVNSMAETLGFTAAQLDDLFRDAATIEA